MNHQDARTPGRIYANGSEGGRKPLLSRNLAAWSLGAGTCFAVLLVSLVLPTTTAPGQMGAPPLRLLISLQKPFEAEPEAARIFLQIHNSSTQPVWLYRRAHGPRTVEPIISEENKPNETQGGSTVDIHLRLADAQAVKSIVSPAEGKVLEYVLMPKPRLEKVEPNADYKETSIVRLRPARADGDKSIWGAYQLTVSYSAAYSNAQEIQRNLAVNLWQGEVTSNTIPVDLRPPLPDSTGVLTGSTLNKDLQPRAGMRVSLQNEQGLLIDQEVTGVDGKFSFEHLPLALYWVTGRQEGAAEDTVTYRHQELTPAAPSGDVQLVFYPQEINDQKQMEHKPVLFRVFDPQGKPAWGVDLDATFSNGEILDDVKGATDADGTVVLELLPGRNSVSLKKRGCAEQVERADVAPGVGADGFKYVYDCAKK